MDFKIFIQVRVVMLPTPEYIAFGGTLYLLQYINSMINLIFKLSVKLHFMSEKKLRSGVIAYPENRKSGTHYYKSTNIKKTVQSSFSY